MANTTVRWRIRREFRTGRDHAALRPGNRTYESAAAEYRRIEADTAKMAAKIGHELGKRPRVIVWPYGEHNDLAVSIAAANGMPITFTLEDGVATVDKLRAVPRHMIMPNPALHQFVEEQRTLSVIDPVRVVQVDLDYVYDPDPAQQERNVGKLVQRIYNMQINTVFLQAFADPKGTGLAREVYFPNRLLRCEPIFSIACPGNCEPVPMCSLRLDARAGLRLRQQRRDRHR